jgi:hypothetical protein
VSPEDDPATTFSEASAEQHRTAGPFAHVSLELGHLTVADLRDEQRLGTYLQSVIPWADAVRAACAARHPGTTARISTCLLVDDENALDQPVAGTLPRVAAVAEAAGTPLDYLARSTACEEADGIQVAALVVDRLVDSPEPNATGRRGRPAARDSGWLCNGQRTPPATPAAAAMSTVEVWTPPREYGAAGPSIFVDVELWQDAQTRRWAPAVVRAVWQLARLDLLRHWGEHPLPPAPPPAHQSSWRDLPAVVALRPAAEPFTAYRAVSIMPIDGPAVAHATATILDRVAPDRKLLDAQIEAAEAEGVTLPEAAGDRLEYLFVTGGR